MTLPPVLRREACPRHRQVRPSLISKAALGVQRLQCRLVLLALCIGPQPSAAHDIYSHLVDSKGASCYNEIDCAPAPFQITPIGIQMLVHGRWIAVPNNKISTDCSRRHGRYRRRALVGDPF